MTLTHKKPLIIKYYGKKRSFLISEKLIRRFLLVRSYQSGAFYIQKAKPHLISKNQNRLNVHYNVPKHSEDLTSPDSLSKMASCDV